LQAWAEEENQALGRGFNGLRAAGNMSWHKKRDWSDLRNYEKSVEDVINSHRMIGLCSYCLDKLEAAEVIDVVQNHQLALTGREGKWEIINNVQRRQLKVSKERRKHDVLLPQRMLTVGQAAQFLGLHPNTVRRWSQIGILKCSHIGTRRHRRFLKKDLEHFVKLH
jgi:excisionase family DNA binding protein